MSPDAPAPSPDDAVDSTEGLAWTSLDPRDSGIRAIVLPVVAEAPAPLKIGPFELGEELGRGAYGTVFRARRLNTQTDVAIKVFNSRLTTEEANQRFRREVAIAAQLNHPHISSIIDTGMHEGSPYIVMRLIRGPTLRDIIEDQGPLPAPEAARIIALAARAIAHAHARSVIHRDLKPSNILLQDGEPIIVDLGLSKSLITDDTFTTKGDLLGSPLFMAPEQLLGEEADPRSDVFALGGLLFFLLSGQTPRSLEEFRARRTPALRLPQGTPPLLADICRRALHPRAERRFPSAEDLAQILEDWRLGRPLHLATKAPASRFFVLLPLLGFAAALILALTLDKGQQSRWVAGKQSTILAGARWTIHDHGPHLGLSVARDDIPLWSPPAGFFDHRQSHVLGRYKDAMILGQRHKKGWTLTRALLGEGKTITELRLEARGETLNASGIVAGVRVDIRGQLEERRGRALIWSRRSKRQLVASLDGLPRWSPPRPGDVTLIGREYPIGQVNGTYFGAIFAAPTPEGQLPLTIVAIPGR